MDHLDEYTLEFLTETREGLDHLDNDLVALEADPKDAERLDSAFRTLHTIKGNAGFLNFKTLSTVAHAGENLLGRVRDQALPLDQQTTSHLLQVVDTIREIASRINNTGSEGDDEYTQLIANISGHLGDEPKPSKAAPKKKKKAATRKKTKKTAEKKTGSETDPLGGQTLEAIPPDLHNSQTHTFTPSGSDIDSDRPVPKPTSEKRESAEPPIEEKAAESDIVKSRSDSSLTFSSPSSSSSRFVAPSGGNIRVNVDLLDKLMNLVGELVLTRNRFLQITSGDFDSDVLAATQRLNQVTGKLQDGILQTRMQQIGTMWQKLPRVVRDLARQCGKEVQLEMSGNETEMDKTMIEAISDPITHVVRNSIDHGIEKPSTRRSTRKPTEGRLHLSATHEGDQVKIEIADDGAGIDFDRLRSRAIANQVFTKEQADEMSPQEIQNLIFLPGISTARAVTDVSGRGVGMDVVKTKIEEIGGTVEVESARGQGTTIRIRVPLTLAIISALIVECDGTSYAIPQSGVVELLRFPRHEANQHIERVHNRGIYRLRGRLLPLVHLREQLQLAKPDSRADSHTEGSEFISIAVLQTSGRTLGLIVDNINTTQEIVVKPLNNALKQIPIYAGATIMGDGSVSLILDVLGLSRAAGLFSRDWEQELEEEPAAVAGHAPLQTHLVCEIGRRRIAIPLSDLTRVERIPRSEVEHTLSGIAIQYRGEILPLVAMRDLFNIVEESPDRDAIDIIIYRDDQRRIGLVVDRILDINTHPIEVMEDSPEQGILGTTQMLGQLTDIADVSQLIESASLTAVEQTT